ncbi:MAG: cytochrome d ubiquinol oxidase subunit II [Desulfovibrionaceae bacterium]|nr:cytochrome d ubiquinol oxidase subunit II [Desulfovibrionaceae bacterium]
MTEVSIFPIIWFVLWGLLWAVYFVMDGFDLGMGVLMPFISSGEEERRAIYNAAGPYWDANEVWLITAGGVTFAAFPKAYAVMFSALYAPLLLLLFALIFRAVSFEYRNKVDSPSWRGFWDLCQFLGSFLPALLLGVAFANLFQGIPIDGDGIYHGNILKLLNPYGLLGGVLFVLMFSYHGALWLGLKADGALREKAMKRARTIWIYLTGVAVAFLAASAYFTTLYNNIINMPLLGIFPLLAVVSLLGSRAVIGSALGAWILSALFIIGATFFGVLGMFPALLPSNMDPAYSLTIMNAASSELTLKIMLGVAGVCVPIVILYQFWVYVTFSYRVTPEELKKEEAY